MKKTLCLTASVLTLLAPAFARAEDTTSIIVSVTREALPVSKIGQSVDVLTDKDIKSYQSLSLADLLTHTGDLTLTRNGGPGQTATASIRGAGADHTLYIFNGIALNDPSQVGGGTDLGPLAVDDASRVEVLRGPLSTLWGSGALGGVVSITTRTAQNPFEADLTAEGFDQYGSARAGIGGKSGGLNWRLFASGTNDQGISAAAVGTEKDGFAQTHFGGNASLALNDAITLNAVAFKTHSRVDIDGFLSVPPFTFGDTGEFTKTDTTLGALGLTDTFSHGEQTLSLSNTDSARNGFDATRFSENTFRGRITSADYHLLYRFSDTTRVLVGAKTERDSYRSTSEFSPGIISSAQQTVSSLYGQVAQDLGTASVTLSARHDDTSSFGGQDIGQLSLSVPAGDHWRFHASAGQGVKIPSLYQLYGDFGTATLKPEKALNIDGGADYSFATGQVSLSLFSRNVHDLIDFDNSTFTYGNIAKSKADGVELGWTQDLSDKWHVRANYAALNTKNLSSGANNGKDVARKPDSVGNVDLTYAATEKLNLGLGVRYVGASFDNAANTVVLKAYTLVDLRVDYALNDTVSLYGRVENAGDTRYQTAATYAQLGRRVWLGIHTRWQ
jgi:vitamin B12 transporter